MNPQTEVWQLMSHPVRRLTMSARVRDAADFLRRWGISGAPVTDRKGRPIGVFSLRDLAGHLVNRVEDLPVIDASAERARATGEPIPEGREFHFEGFDDTRVSELMTPSILCVDPEAPVMEAVRMMQQKAIHRIFVRRGRGPLLGVLTTMDVLRWVDATGMADRKKTAGKKVV